MVTTAFTYEDLIEMARVPPGKRIDLRRDFDPGFSGGRWSTERANQRLEEGTKALVSLSLMNIFLALNLRIPRDSALQGSTFSNVRLLYAYLWVVIGSILITETGLFRAIFQTVSLTPYQWLLCLLPGVVLLIVGEVYKAYLR